MSVDYKPLAERAPDRQYIRVLRHILRHGQMAEKTPQGVGALTCFGTTPKMIFPIANGIPLLTERKMSTKQAIAEITAFINGIRDLEELEKWGCVLWKDYKGKGSKYGLSPNDLGPGSYGGVFHDFPMPNGKTFNQFAHIIEQIKNYPHLRTLRISNWIPFYIGRGGLQKAIVSPCHGELHFRVINGKLDMLMVQRSGDTPIGVPHNMFQYGALLLMMAQVTGLKAGTYIHDIADAHIYEDQLPSVRKLIRRKSKPFPILQVDPSVKDLFAFRPEHFTIQEYEPHPPVVIPYRP